MSLLESIASKAFLGEEFLTWLLWRSETRNGLVGLGDLEVHFASPLALRATFGDAEEVTLRGEAPAAAPELFAALAQGKLLARAAMRWVVEGAEWHLAVRGATLDFAGLRLPLRSAPPDAAWLERRLELLEIFARAFDAAFAEFLTIRLADRAWAKEAAAMRDWIAAGPQGTGPPEVVEITDTER